MIHGTVFATTTRLRRASFDGKHIDIEVFRQLLYLQTNKMTASTGSAVCLIFLYLSDRST